MSISANLRQLRQGRGMTQEQAAQQVGVTRQALSSYESGRTRPDIDMLLRLAQVYGTDLNGILYGREEEQKTVRILKRIAAVVLGLTVLLALAGALLLWSANMFLPIPEGHLTEEMRAVWERRQALTSAWTAVEGINLTLAKAGPALLLVLMLAWGRILPWKEKLAFTGVWIAGLWLVTLPFALTDPLFAFADYGITLYLMTFDILAFLIVILTVDAFRLRRRRARTGRAGETK